MGKSPGYGSVSMNDHADGVYLPTSDPNTYQSTALANAGWYEEGQHGGALAALVVGHAEQIPTLTPMEVSRVTLELFRVVPLVPLTLDASVVREGKKIQMVEIEVRDHDGKVLAMAMVQRLRTSDRPPPEQEQAKLRLVEPETTATAPIEHWGHGEAGKVMFHRNAIEARQIYGGFAEMGPGAIWIRLTKPIIAGSEITPAQRAVAVADFSNGVARELDNTWIFMNPDLTVHLGRYPVGEWTALEAISHYGALGRGVATGTIWDEQGWIGRSTQSLFLDRVNN